MVQGGHQGGASTNDGAALVGLVSVGIQNPRKNTEEAVDERTPEESDAHGDLCGGTGEGSAHCVPGLLCEPTAEENLLGESFFTLVRVCRD